MQRAPAATSPVATRISTQAGSSAARSAAAPSRSRARRIAAAAASPFPCASRINARPGCGSRPKRLASRYAASACIELALEAMNLRLPIRSMAESALVQDSLRELLGDAPCFLERVPPGAAERHDLGAMHEAEALVRDHVRLLLAPARQRLRPLAARAEARTRRDRTRSCCSRRCRRQPVRAHRP